MNKYLATLFFVVISPITLAGYIADADVGRIHTKSNGYVYVGISSPPTDTCNWFSEIFRFDARTAEGQSMLSNLLAAKAAGRRISVWYNASSTPGTLEPICSESTLAIITGIAQQ